MEGLLWFYNMLIASGCDPYHASAATAFAAILGVYVFVRSIMHLITGR